ncbi:peptidoglycan -binding protein [Geminicoccus roseus]|uniref:peptidoglycan -binding protein n=1 Tax=Geminicoccus roseus TaxID=404900 RepID=UPI0006869FF4|nr:peptidoglycan -binding protein [Geminicoccus roseus]
MTRIGLFSTLFAVLPLACVLAQEPVPSADAKAQSVEDVQALVDKIKRQLEEMDAATKQRDEGLQFLQEQIDQATGRLEGSGAANEALRARVGELGTTVDDLAAQQKLLDENLQATAREKETLEQQLARKIAELEAVLASERADSTAAMAAKQLQVEETAARVANLEGELAAERSRLQGALAQEQAAASEATDSLKSARAELDSARTRITELEGLLDSTRTALVALEGTLGETRTRVNDQQATIEDLGQRLNEALARKVEELSRYRSEFFGILSQALGDRPDIRVVGDRFVLQSELLFDPGSAEIGPAGREELAKVADTLQQIAETIPENVPWILRVDGHTDRQPIRSGRYASNWELSTARAVAVVQYLISRGLPPDRLVAAGFGEYKPLDPREDEIAYRRNRRIEFKLTES